MPVYRRSTTVRAPLNRVWEFHTRIDGLRLLTPSILNLEVESIEHPDGTADPEDLRAGTQLELSVRPFGIGPRRTVTVAITDREEAYGSAFFRDEMLDGPLERWEHTHRLYGDEETTTVIDRIEYELGRYVPGQRVFMPVANPVSRAGLTVGFAYRHRETCRLLEGFSGSGR